MILEFAPAPRPSNNQYMILEGHLRPDIHKPQQMKSVDNFGALDSFSGFRTI